MSTTQRMVIVAHRPWLHVFTVVLALIAGAGAMYVLSGSYREPELTSDANAAGAELGEKLAVAKKSNDVLRSENKALKDRVATLKRAQQVDSRARAKLQDDVKQFQSDILKFKEEVSFYRGIVSSGRKGLNIHNFALSREGKSSVYRFEVVLTKNLKSEKIAQGDITLSIAGEYQGQARELSAEELLTAKNAKLGFKFKHFQRLEGRFSLPEGFVPRRIYVNATTKGKKPQRVDKAYEWKGALDSQPA